MNEITFKPILKPPHEFFEGFKTPTEYISFGEKGKLNSHWSLNKEDYNSNLLFFKKSHESEVIIKKIIHFYENQNEIGDKNKFSLITRIDSETYIMLMTFVEIKESYGLLQHVKLDKTVQLLNDTKSKNGCLKALQELCTQQENKSIEQKDFLKIEAFLKSQLSPKGWQKIKDYAPELLTQLHDEVMPKFKM